MSERTKFIAYITKYALTKGILETEVEDCFDISPDMVKAFGCFGQCFHGGDWWRTREEAVVKANLMVKNRVASLEKQIAKLAKLKFE